jgi:hypothetical protein
VRHSLSRAHRSRSSGCGEFSASSQGACVHRSFVGEPTTG